MRRSHRTLARRAVRLLSLPVLLASVPFLTGCGAAVPALMVGTYATADAFFMPLRAVVGTVLLALINGTL